MTCLNDRPARPRRHRSHPSYPRLAQAGLCSLLAVCGCSESDTERAPGSESTDGGTTTSSTTSNWPNGTTSGTTTYPYYDAGEGGQGGAGPCDEGTLCQTCMSSDCAEQQCGAEFDACSANPDCPHLNLCYTGCDDSACLTACNQEYPDAVSEAAAMYVCLCSDACPNDCAEFVVCQSSPHGS